MNDDLRFYIGILKRRFLPFLAVFAVVSAIATIIVLALPPLYRSEATILVESQQIPDKMVESTVVGTAEERIQITRQKVSAREELLRVAEKFDLFPGKRQGMSATKLVDELRRRITIEPAELKGARQIGSSNASIAFKVGFDYERPQVAANVANELLDMILGDDISQQTSTAKQTVSFLSNESDRLAKELSRLEEEITKFKLENQEALPERVSFLQSALERAQDNRKEIEREIDALIEEKRLLELELVLRESQAIKGEAGSPNSIQAQLDALKNDLALKSATFTASHPEIKRLKAEVRRLEDQLVMTPADTASGTEDLNEKLKQKMSIDQRVAAEKRDAIDRKINLYQSQRQSIEQSITSITKLLNDSPEVQGKVTEFERQRAALQKSIDDIANKLSQARLALQLIEQQHGERFRVIEQPIVPQDPIWPKVPKFLAIGYGSAAVAGGSLVGLLEIMNRSVRSANDIVKALNRYPMVVIPYMMTKEEGRRRFRKYIYIIAAIVLALIVAVLALHFLFMPIEELYDKVLYRLGL